jgi:histidinol-phosphate/aromatic aminotransferase/cobyric acid decarboxylase-like protein/choline kinase
MQAIILAAGVGRRLGSLTKDSTKCMVTLNGRRLIEYAFDALVEAKIPRAVMVVGHGAEELQTFLGESCRGVKVEYVLNPIYARSNNIYSLLLAKDFLKRDDSLLLESDVIFEKSLLAECLADKDENLAVVAKFQPWMDGTVTTLDGHGYISNFISKKDLDWLESERYYKTVNIYKLSRDFSRKKLVPFLKTYIETKGIHEYYEEVLKVLTFIDAGTLKAFEMGERIWYEIDDIQDLDIASVLFSDEAKRLALLKKRYGGYWRFPHLKDFCYLVNPFFPPKRMILELGRHFAPLLTSYPSGLNVQNLLAAKLFGGNDKQYLVGNGASELIKAVLPELPGKIGLSVPTFDEYVECAGPKRIVEFRPPGDNFHYTVDDILDFCRTNDIGVYILINPDNPSGHFLPKPEVARLLKSLRERGVRLILDESFSDFVDGTDAHSFLAGWEFESFENLIVIKSISKSYGVPGLRLGVLASSDASLLARVRPRLAIWNINSFAEKFLQIVDKYKSEFQDACRKIGAERKRFFGELKKIGFLEPLPSKANYILCRMKGARKSEELAQALLRKKWILVKDCTGKRGFENKSFIRLTVRNKEDNDFLLEALRSF